MNHEHKPLREPPDERPVACHCDFLFKTLFGADTLAVVRAMIECGCKLDDIAHSDQTEEFLDVLDVDDMRWSV